MKKTYFLFTLVLLFCVLPAVSYAQDSDVQTRKKWFQEVRNYKYDFFAKEMELTKEQQNAFFPEYEAMEKAIFMVNKEAREMESKITNSKDAVSDTEYEAAALALTKIKQKEGEIEMEYFTKFEKILSKKQLFLLKRAENKFTQSILNYHKKAAK